MTLRFAVAVSLMLAAPSLSDAATLFEQLPAQNSGSLLVSSTIAGIDQGVPVPGSRLADNFQLAVGGTVRTVDWLGSPVLGGQTFQITFYADASGGPGASLSTISVTPTITLFSPGPLNGVYSYSAILSTPFSAAPATQYWVSVFDDAPDGMWWWRSGNLFGSGDLGRRMQNGSSTWDPNTATNFVPDLAFRLTDDVPEPATFSLMAIAILGFACFDYYARVAKSHIE